MAYDFAAAALAAQERLAGLVAIRRAETEFRPVLVTAEGMATVVGPLLPDGRFFRQLGCTTVTGR